MALLRLLVAATILGAGAATAGAAWWLLQPEDAGESGAYAIDVVGPHGATLFRGMLAVENATVLTLLLAAAGEGGFSVETEEYPGMGTYVRAIGGHEARAMSGWIYEVRRDGEWRLGDRSAALYALRAGDAVRWSWTDG